MTVIVCYAPTEEAEDEMKDEFYEQLEEAIPTTPQHDMLLVNGDFNARVGMDNTDKERTMDTHGIGHINNNGERLVELCEENNLVIGGTQFKHKDIHKVTWRSPSYNTVTKIDHVIINQKCRRSLHDVKVRRGADVGSDHMFVMATLSLKLCRARRGEERQLRFDVEKSRKP